MTVFNLLCFLSVCIKVKPTQMVNYLSAIKDNFVILDLICFQDMCIKY